MFKPTELFIGLRYTRARRGRYSVSFLTLAAMLGIALGVTAMITVMSVMNGFQKEVRDRMLDMVAHITVSRFDGRIENWEEISHLLAAEERVESTAPYVQAEGMLIRQGEVNGSFIRGILPDKEDGVSRIAKHMEEGKLSDLQSGAFRIILGRDLARRLGALPGDKVTLVTPSADITVAGISPRMKRFTVSGIFFAGHSLYDGSLALMHINDAQKLFRMKGEVSGLRIRLDDFSAA